MTPRARLWGPSVHRLGRSPRCDVVPLAAALAEDADWRDLAAAALEPNVFMRPEMLAAAAGRIAPPAWWVVKAIGPRGRLDGLAVIRDARALPVVGPRLVDGFWSHYGPLGTPLLRADAPDAAAGLLDGLSRVTRTIRLRYLALDGPVVAALGNAALARGGRLNEADIHHRALLTADAPAADALGSGLAGRRARELGRQLRQFGRDRSIEWHTATDPAAVAIAVDRFIDIEASGWKGRGGTSLSADPQRAAFARAFTAALAEAGALRTDTLTVDARPIAVLLTLIDGDEAFLWKIAHLESAGAASPGVQLVRRLTEAALADPALRRVDSLATPGNPLVERLWTGRRRIGTLLIAPTAEGLAALDRAVAAHRRATQLRAAARRLRDRLRR